MTNNPNILDLQSPNSFLSQNYLDVQNVPMRNPDPESNEAVARRLQILRRTVSKDNQAGFAVRLGIEPKRWNNFERGTPLSKEIAFLIVKKFPDFTLDWLWHGKTKGMPQSLQWELEEVGKSITTSRPSGRRGA